MPRGKLVFGVQKQDFNIFLCQDIKFSIRTTNATYTGRVLGHKIDRKYVVNIPQITAEKFKCEFSTVDSGRWTFIRDPSFRECSPLSDISSFRAMILRCSSLALLLVLFIYHCQCDSHTVERSDNLSPSGSESPGASDFGNEPQQGTSTKSVQEYKHGLWVWELDWCKFKDAMKNRDTTSIYVNGKKFRD